MGSEGWGGRKISDLKLRHHHIARQESEVNSFVNRLYRLTEKDVHLVEKG
jgi:hypothetical protein